MPLLQEVEKQYKEGTAKHAIVQVLVAVKPEALNAQGEQRCDAHADAAIPLSLLGLDC